MVDHAKRDAESIWVLRHAMMCPLDHDERCAVAGCYAAKQVLRVMEAQDKQAVGDLSDYPQLARAVDAAREALEKQKDPLVCALVCRARARKKKNGGLILDFSQRHDEPDFSVPGQPALIPPDLRRSSTTEELALLLSDLSRREEPVKEPTRRTRSAAAAEKPRRRRPSEDNEDSRPSKKRPVRPPSRYRDEKRDMPPPPRRSPVPTTTKAVSPRRRPTAAVPRSPSFSAAASSLLALTGVPDDTKKFNNGPPLLMPQC